MASLNDYLHPILSCLGDGEEHQRKDLVGKLEKDFGLVSDENPRRTTILINNAIGYMRKAGLLEIPRVRTYKIKQAGLDLLANKPEAITLKFLFQFPELAEFMKNRARHTLEDDSDTIEAGPELPEDAIEKTHEIYEQDLADELLETVRRGSWQFFEQLVLDLMVKMGYGDPNEPANLKRGPGDEGIDGIIKQDRLGLDIICLQAKKWEANVSRPEIQKFTGSLDGARSRKGVFITTSSFSEGAIEYANQIEKKIILIDGRRLARLMIDYNLGVSEYKNYAIKRIDSDYFEEV